jgi:hypothetical protein
MKNRIITLILAISLTLSLAACASDSPVQEETRRSRNTEVVTTAPPRPDEHFEVGELPEEGADFVPEQGTPQQNQTSLSGTDKIYGTWIMYVPGGKYDELAEYNFSPDGRMYLVMYDRYGDFTMLQGTFSYTESDISLDFTKEYRFAGSRLRTEEFDNTDTGPAVMPYSMNETTLAMWGDTWREEYFRIARPDSRWSFDYQGTAGDEMRHAFGSLAIAGGMLWDVFSAEAKQNIFMAAIDAFNNGGDFADVSFAVMFSMLGETAKEAGVEGGEEVVDFIRSFSGVGSGNSQSSSGNTTRLNSNQFLLRHDGNVYIIDGSTNATTMLEIRHGTYWNGNIYGSLGDKLFCYDLNGNLIREYKTDGGSIRNPAIGEFLMFADGIIVYSAPGRDTGLRVISAEDFSIMQNPLKVTVDIGYGNSEERVILSFLDLCGIYDNKAYVMVYGGDEYAINLTTGESQLNDPQVFQGMRGFKQYSGKFFVYSTASTFRFRK